MRHVLMDSLTRTLNTHSQDELKRALISAGGWESLPPTAKDVDDTFTLFSSQTSAGVGGGKVEVATVLRGLRGLRGHPTPCRAKVVRDVFRRVLKFSSGGSTRIVTCDPVGTPGQCYGGDGGIVGANIRGAERDYGENTTVSVEQLKEVCCGRRCSPAIAVGHRQTPEQCEGGEGCEQRRFGGAVPGVLQVRTGTQ